jgi:hypothetical protein
MKDAPDVDPVVILHVKDQIGRSSAASFADPEDQAHAHSVVSQSPGA